MLLDVFIRIGTNLFLMDYAIRSRSIGIDALYIDVPLRIAELILSLEEYGKTKHIDSAFESRYAASKRSYLVTGLGSTKRDVLKFYRKRTSCSCLKDMHLKARKIMPKMGLCFGCGQMKERASLSACSRCMVSTYCSRDCQVAHWPVHRQHCDTFVRAHNHNLLTRN